MVVPAMHKLLGDVAVKFSFRLADDELLKKEFRMLARIGQFHPNMVHVYGMILHPHRRQNLGQPGMVMELMRGGDLHDLIYECRYSYEIGHIIGWMSQALSAICHLHQNGIIHRDVKPRNILLSADFTIVKLCDFGMTRPEQNEMTPAQGSPYWLAPECLHKNYDRKMDVFASAIVMWQLLSRKKPHENRMGSILAILHADPDVRPEKIDCEPALWSLIERSWCTSTDDRLSAIEMLTELREQAEIFPWAGPIVQLPTSPSSSSVNSSRRNSLNQQNPLIVQSDQDFGNAEEKMVDNVLNDLFEEATVNPGKLMFEISTQTDDPNEETLEELKINRVNQSIEFDDSKENDEQTLHENWVIEPKTVIDEEKEMEMSVEMREDFDETNGDPNLEDSHKEKENIYNAERMEIDHQLTEIDQQLTESDHKKFNAEFDDHWGIKDEDSSSPARIVDEHSTSRRSYSYNLTISSSSRSSAEELERLKAPRKSEQEQIDELNELRLTCHLYREKLQIYEEAERLRNEKEEENKKLETESLAVLNTLAVRLESRSESGFDERSMKCQSIDPLDMKTHFDRIMQFIVDDEFSDFHIEKLDQVRDLFEHVVGVLKGKVFDWKQLSPKTTKGWLDVLDGLHSITEALSLIIAHNSATIYQETQKDGNRASARRFKAGVLLCQHTLARRQLGEVRAFLDRETKVMAKQRDFHHNAELAEIYDQMVALLEKISDLPQKKTTTSPTTTPTFTSKPIPF
ncbi:unnamed protein product, partial [Mesorhabditis belari]|uniref:Protein kinase domain-containing protein n=1 Tax=Mesorhabditis belari TaxID=2138241 RepID=A0AAF3EFI4_9BILA